jgi:hypothetical protein
MTQIACGLHGIRPSGRSTGVLRASSGGSGRFKKEMATWLGQLVVQLQAATAKAKSAAASGKAAAQAAIDKVDTLKAEVAGMLAAAHTSPLPYGGDPTTAPEGATLAGAFEWRLDPANTEKPSTLPRSVLALVLLVGGGLLGGSLISRRLATSGTAGGAGTPAAAGGAAAGGAAVAGGQTPEGWSSFGDQSGWSPDASGVDPVTAAGTAGAAGAAVGPPSDDAAAGAAQGADAAGDAAAAGGDATEAIEPVDPEKPGGGKTG